MKYLICLFLFSLNLKSVHALEIDEKLTLRFLKVSNTKKTVLINRGSEDGLVTGDHAKFFMTSGVIARGVVEKISPSRSIWSLYRVVDPEEVTENKVLNLKIASPVKVTVDSTKSMKEEIPSGSDKLEISEKDNEELQAMEDEEELPKVNKVKVEKRSPVKKSESKDNIIFNDKDSKSYEIYGFLSLNALNGTIESSTGATSTSASSSNLDLTVGIEKYFHQWDGFWKSLSLGLILHKRTAEDGDEVKSTSSYFEYGLVGNYFYHNQSNDLNSLIGYMTLGAGAGSTEIKTKVVSGASSTETTSSGSDTFLFIGVGAKYNLNNDFGMRAVLDYYTTSESYSYDTGSTSTRKLSGPRMQMGLSYRF